MSYNNAIAGATALNVTGGMSGFTCGLASDLALAGFTAQEDAIEEALGSLVGDGFETDRLLDELGMRWEITRDWFRLRACCNPIYAALDGAAAETRTRDVDPERRTPEYAHGRQPRGDYLWPYAPTRSSTEGAAFNRASSNERPPASC